MAQRESGTHEAIFFIDNHSVSKRMLFSEFEALLDGMGTLQEYADSDAKIVYCVISKTGKIKALVFFKLYFDEDGRADPSWNVPIERLAEVSGSGPDLGGGPIRLACRSQCSINWHLEDLWDPDMTPGSNDFVVIKKAVVENRLRLAFASESAVEKVPTVHGISDAQLDDELDLETEKRVKLARLLKEQRLRIRTLESQRDEAGDSSEREQRIIVHAYKNEIQNLKQHVEQLRVTNERLQEKLSARNAQFIDLQDRVSKQTELVAGLEKRLANADEGERESLEKQKLEAELVLLKDKLERKEIDLAYRDEREDQLRSELEELKESQSSGVDSDALLSRLRDLEVVYVAYHPGAGHINMTTDEITSYAANPIAFVAEKCFVTEAHYRAWLKHYENPTCETCHCPVEKAAMPSEFEPGISNLCEQHQA